MYNKFNRLLIVFALLFFTCENEETLNITEPAAQFTLQEPGISNINLNFGLATNPAFTISWNDEVTGASSYDIEMALTDTFDAPVMLGSSTGSSFSINTEDLNMAINSAGPEIFSDVPTYVRVDAGSAVSNTILFFVDAYVTNPAMITGPDDGGSYVLDIASQDIVLFQMTWEDDALTTADNVDYSIEAAIAGTDFASIIPVGSVSNGTSLDITHSDLNQVALGLEVAPDTPGDIEIRIKSLNTNSSGNTYERISESIVITVTPYNVAFPYLYLVGDATTPGWSNNNNNTAVFRSQDTPNSYHFTGYFGNGAFKILENLGSWHPQWGDRNNSGTLGVSNPDGSNEASVFPIPAPGYYTFTANSMIEGGSYSLTPYDAAAAPTYGSIGIIGDATPNGWGSSTPLTQDPNNPHLWFINDVNLTNGQFLIRANNVWPPDANAAVWRYTGSDELFGSANLDNGGGDNFPFDGPAGQYDVWFNDLDGSYVIIPQ